MIVERKEIDIIAANFALLGSFSPPKFPTLVAVPTAKPNGVIKDNVSMLIEVAWAAVVVLFCNVPIRMVTIFQPIDSNQSHIPLGIPNFK